MSVHSFSNRSSCLLAGYFFAGCLTLFGLVAGAAELKETPVSFCGPLLEAVPYDPAVLAAKGIDVGTLTFKMKLEDKDTYEIIAFVKGKRAGAITVFRDSNPSVPAFRSSMVLVNDEFLGKGVGTMLYVIAAKFVREREGARLRSDFEPEPEAVAVWKRFVGRGFAEQIQVTGAKGAVIENYYYLRPDRVDELAKDIYPLYLERLQKP